MSFSVLLSALASFALLAAVFVPLERLFPARPGQKILRRNVTVDVCFFAGQYLAWTSVAVWVLARVEPLVRHSPLSASTSLPLVIQVVLAVAGGDFVVYWFHRACHAWGPLWRFHAVHHTAEELDWVAAHREHPVDGVITQLCMNLPAFVLGVPMSALAGIIVFRGIWAVFIHSNVRLPLGPLRFLFGAPELHHWHHARLERTAHNFSNLGPWVDVLFGTYHRPLGEENYPLGVPESWPQGYLAQLAKPFRRDPRKVTGVRNHTNESSSAAR